MRHSTLPPPSSTKEVGNLRARAPKYSPQRAPPLSSLPLPLTDRLRDMNEGLRSYFFPPSPSRREDMIKKRQHFFFSLFSPPPTEGTKLQALSSSCGKKVSPSFFHGEGDDHRHFRVPADRFPSSFFLSVIKESFPFPPYLIVHPFPSCALVGGVVDVGIAPPPSQANIFFFPFPLEVKGKKVLERPMNSASLFLARMSFLFPPSGPRVHEIPRFLFPRPPPPPPHSGTKEPACSYPPLSKPPLTLRVRSRPFLFFYPLRHWISLFFTYFLFFFESFPFKSVERVRLSLSFPPCDLRRRRSVRAERTFLT